MKHRTPEEEFQWLRFLNRKLHQRVEQLKLKFDVMHRAIIDLAGTAVVPTSSPLAELAPVETILQEGAEVTVVAFSGMLTQLGMPPRQFYRSMERHKRNVLFVKDFAQCWYQKGLTGLSYDLSSTADALRRIIPAGTRHLRTIGTSSGGFAAIYFGAKLGADRAVAFGPQTTIGPEEFRRFGSADSRVADFDFSDSDRDLATVLDRLNPTKGRIEVWFAANNSFDRGHANNIAGRPCVHLVEVPDTDNHNIAGVLRERGELDAFLADLARP